MKLPRSVIAVVGAFSAALIVQGILGLAMKLATPSLSGLTGRSLSVALIAAYLFGTVFPGIAAGLALGRLAPDKPSVHVAVVALLSPLGSYLIVDPAGLPHGWQIVGYGAQLMLIELVTLRTFRPRGRRPAGFSARPA
jgi:hypothetical protein